MMDVFTSISINYLPKAKILARSLKKFHPDWKFHLLISDQMNKNYAEDLEENLSKDIFDEIMWIERLHIPDMSSWIFKHTVVELCTAVKGIFLNELANNGVEKIIYLDPDIAIFNSLSPLEDMLDNHAIIIAPHLLKYTDNSQSIQDNEIAGTLRHGIFNLGFLAINTRREDGSRFTSWWYRRLLDYCYADYDRGLFTDQKWCDLIPAFFEDFFILRDPGYDVASWNLDCRELSINSEGQLTINKEFPLRFYHFTGYDSGAGLSAITQLATNSQNFIVKELWDWYNRELLNNGQDQIGHKQCSFDYFENGEIITKEMRQIFRMSPDLQKRFYNPYQTSGKCEKFLTWWNNEYLRNVD